MGDCAVLAELFQCAIKREDNGAITEVPDGITFPILASLAAFAVKSEEGWTIKYPQQFRDDDLIAAAKDAYMQIADSNPNVMGKSKACFSSLARITSIFKRLS